MGTIGKERKVIMASIFLVFLGLVTAIINDRTDHIYRTAVATVGLSIPLILPAKVPDPPERLRPFLAPIYNEGTMMILAVFIAVHVPSSTFPSRTTTSSTGTGETLISSATSSAGLPSG